MPFKYKTLLNFKKILACQEVDEEAKEFRLRAPRYKNYLYTEQINKDIVRTKILKSNERLHQDVHKVLEFYCYKKNVTYCQGMIEVLMPFLLMKQHENYSSAVSNGFSSVSNQSSSSSFDLALVYSYFKRFV
jgi:hypothetical protein